MKRWRTAALLHYTVNHTMTVLLLLHVKQCEWYLVKHPDLSVDRGPWHSVAVVVKQDSLLLGVTPQRRAQLLHLVHCGVQTLLVARLQRHSVPMITSLLKPSFWFLNSVYMV